MVVSAGSDEHVVWHELECGSYAADLPLWLELAGAAATGGRAGVLDIGAGSGRVAIELARHGHHVTAVERDARLLAALRERAGAIPAASVEAVCADARTLALDRRDFDLCVVPMQTLQMFDGAAARRSFLQAARAHLTAGGVLACAIVIDVDAFDCAAGDIGPSPEIADVDGASFISKPTRVRVGKRTISIERERRIVPAASGEPATGRRRALERDTVELDRVSVAQLQREGREAGLTVLDARQIPATDEHAGSTAVIFGA
jgi:SAM-dependent methyltransferase